MSLRSLLSLAALSALGACTSGTAAPPPATSSTPTASSTVATAAGPVVGGVVTPGELRPILNRPLVNNAGVVTVNDNGTVTGTLNGRSVDIAWELIDGRFCRSGTVGAVPIARVCQTITIAGNQVRFINPDGSVSSVYTF